MGINSLSLRARSAIVALISLLLFTPLAIIAIDRAYTATLKETTLNQLKLTALMLISEFEFEDDAPNMPIWVHDEKLNITGSGVYGYIRWKNALVWHSVSSEDIPEHSMPSPPETGEELWIETDSSFVYGYTAEFETDWGYSPVHFFAEFDKTTFSQARHTFLATLWSWLSALNIGLLVCLIMGLRFLLRPLSRLRDEIKKSTSDRQNYINDDYPEEIKPLTVSINHLIETEQSQRERYKNSLSDLAHSLKTPLTVALGEAKANRALSQPLIEIKAIIERQLKRASATSDSWYTSTSVLPLVEKLVNAMQKVHAEKSLQYAIDVSNKIVVSAESTDLMECLGNIVDNASKAAKSTVHVNAKTDGDFVQIHVEDDGPGVPIDKRDSLLSRGKRLDTYKEGQGIGLALVVDILSGYGGELKIGESSLGGAKFTLYFPINYLMFH